MLPRGNLIPTFGSAITETAKAFKKNAEHEAWAVALTAQGLRKAGVELESNEEDWVLLRSFWRAKNEARRLGSSWSQQCLWLMILHRPPWAELDVSQ